MNKSYCDEVSETLTTFVTECIFVGYTIRGRKGKQKKHFLRLLGLLFISLSLKGT